jgi:hypothetical protein
MCDDDHDSNCLFLAQLPVDRDHFTLTLPLDTTTKAYFKLSLSSRFLEQTHATFFASRGCRWYR